MSANPNASQELPPGQVFEGKYKILRELGRGGFGMVYLAFQEGMDRHVALKVLKSSVTAQAPSAKDRFLREVKIISKLKHPNTVTIHDFGETYDGGCYMVLEYVEGETLKQVLKREGPQDMLRAADITRQVARSLAEAHRHGVVHRDLKPANIMITSLDADRDFVKVLDFGVARLLDSKTDDLTSIGLPEGERELIGTPRYMSPEQVRGESLNGASDIYGLGLMLYELLCGEPAVQGDTTMGLITQQISPEPLKLPHSASFNPIIQDIIRISTAKQLSDRFQTAEQMADALEQAIFTVRRERNLTGPPAGDGSVPMSGYHSQLAQMQPGYNPGGSGRNSGWNAPIGESGNYGFQSGGHEQMPSMSVGPGFDSRQSGPVPRAAQFDDFDHGGSGHWDGGGGRGISMDHPFGTGPAAAISSHSVDAPVLSSGFNEIELPIDDDFQPTMERDALDPAQLIKRPQALFDRNQHPSADMPVAGGLPPVPSDERPFAPQAAPLIDRPPPQQRGKREREPAPDLVRLPPQSKLVHRRPDVVSDESLGEFSKQVLKGCVFGAAALASTYLAFIVVGAVLAPKTGGMARLLAATVVALVLPGIALFGEMANREKFRIAESIAGRIARVFLHTSVFAIAVVIVGSGACANDVVYELQDEPNWFMQDPEARGFASLNKRISYGLAGVVADVMGAVGLYDKRARAARVAVPDAPGRTKPLPKSTRAGNEQLRPVAPDDDAAELRDSKKAASEYESW